MANRGRPKKDKGNLKNEDAKQITMAEKSSSTTSVTQEPVSYTLELTRARWANIFSKYAAKGYDAFSSAWGLVATSQLNNPFIQNARIKQINSLAIKLESEELQQALSNPSNSESVLQGASWDLYYSNYVYNSLVKLNRDTPKYNYYALPLYVSKNDMKSDNFRKEAQRIDKLLKVLDPNLTFKTISTQVNIEGKCSYLPRISEDNKGANFFVFQKLNSNMVKLTGFGSRQQFVASFNMMIFAQPGYDVKLYPPFIRECWEKMTDSKMVIEKKGAIAYNPKAKPVVDGVMEWSGNNFMYWVQLPQDLCYTFYTDGAHSDVFPDMIGLFNDFSDLDDYRWLQANLLSKGVNSVLTAEVPLAKEAKAGTDATIITPDTVLGYSDLFGNNISGNIFPFFAPFN